VDLLRDYLLRSRPPSGGFFCPLLGRGRWDLRPSMLARALAWAPRTGLRSCVPDAMGLTISRMSSNSLRKSLSQWLWDA
jgi:hypothetical protein